MSARSRVSSVPIRNLAGSPSGLGQPLRNLAEPLSFQAAAPVGASSESSEPVPAAPPPPPQPPVGTITKEASVPKNAGGETERLSKRGPESKQRLYARPARSWWCTDCCCLFVLLAWTASMSALAFSSLESGDHRRLLHGFDFRGRLCAGPHGGGEFVHWCELEGKVRWDLSICVEQCPTKDEALLCPDGLAEAVESEEERQDGTIVLLSIMNTTLLPTLAGPTRQLYKYCIPQEFSKDALASATSQLTSSSQVLQLVAGLSDCFFSIHVMVFLAVLALIAGHVWVCLWQAFAQIMAHSFLIAPLIAMIVSGATTLLAPDMSVCQGMLAALASSLDVHAGADRLRIGFGAALLAASLGMLLVYLRCRRAISVTACSLREACHILLCHPMLLLVLPILELALMAAAALAAGFGAVALLSTADVNAGGVEVLGITVSGIFRTFSWNSGLVIGLLCWFFTFQWYQELIHALFSFVLSSTTVTWYFAPDTYSQMSWLPLLTKLASGCIFHLGSLALGAFTLACMRYVRWIFTASQWLMKDRPFGPTPEVLAAFLAFCRTLGSCMNENAYTDLVLTPSSYCTASQSAAHITMSNAAILWPRMWVLRPLQYLGAAMYSLALGFSVHLAASQPSEILALALPSKLVNELQVEGRPLAAGVLAAGMSFLVVRVFSRVVNRVSDAVLYCFLWDKQDGVLDAKHTPEGFKAFLAAVEES